MHVDAMVLLSEKLKKHDTVGSMRLTVEMDFHPTGKDPLDGSKIWPYGKKNFEKDIALLQLRNGPLWKDKDSPFIDAEMRERATDDKLGRSEILYNKDIAYAIKTGKTIKPDWHEFKKLCLKLITQYIAYLLKDDLKAFQEKGITDPVTGDVIVERRKELTVRVLVVDSIERELVAAFEIVEGDTIILELSGALLVGRLYGLYQFTQHIDGAYFEKALGHEFQHAFDNERTKEYYKREHELNDAIKKVRKGIKGKASKLRGTTALIFFLLASLADEGVSVFYEWKHRESVVLHLGVVHKIIYLLEHVAKQEPRKANWLYDKKFETDYGSGEYYVGYVMCAIIALGVVKKQEEQQGKAALIRVKHPEEKLMRVEDFDAYWRKHKLIKLAPFDPKTVEQTCSALHGIRYEWFFDTFYNSCKDLGLRGKTAFLTHHDFKRICKHAGLDFEKYAPTSMFDTRPGILP